MSPDADAAARTYRRGDADTNPTGPSSAARATSSAAPGSNVAALSTRVPSMSKTVARSVTVVIVEARAAAVLGGLLGLPRTCELAGLDAQQGARSRQGPK